MDSSRRWSGFVCPDCRFVFRVPRDHDGQGVVCPSCRRLLKIPQAGDQPPPLVVSLRPTSVDESPHDAGLCRRGSQRRTKKSRHGEDHAWDRKVGRSRRSGLVEKRQMLWMLIGGAGLFALMVTGVLLALRSKPAPCLHGGDPPAGKRPPPPSMPEVVCPTAPSRTEVEILAEVEPLARKFLDATRIEELLPLVRNPAVAEARMRSYYPTGKIDAPGLAVFNPDSSIVTRGTISALKIRTRSYDDKSLALVDTPRGLKIDWESWVGWADMPWEQFLAQKPTTPQVFRLNLSALDYYNFAFADDKKWQAYQLTAPAGGRALYGYVERGSPVAAMLPPASDSQPVAMMLALKFPPNASSANQVFIDRFIAEGWVLESESAP